MRPGDTFQEVAIGVGAPPLEHHVRRYQQILHKLYGYDEDAKTTTTNNEGKGGDGLPSYASLDFEQRRNKGGDTYLEVDLNPSMLAPARKRASTVQATDEIPIPLSLQVHMNPTYAGDETEQPGDPHSPVGGKPTAEARNKRRRSSLPVLYETTDIKVNKDLFLKEDSSSGYSGSSGSFKDTAVKGDEAALEIEKF